MKEITLVAGEYPADHGAHGEKGCIPAQLNPRLWQYLGAVRSTHRTADHQEVHAFPTQGEGAELARRMRGSWLEVKSKK